MDFSGGTVIVRHFRGSRTGDRVVEGTSLENWHRRKPIEGSNPSLSATAFPLDIHKGLYLIPFGVKIWCREAIVRA
jgi:hypothetical protein